ncbi:MAG: hypothetical protein ACI8QZ_003376 [Chlamydiales bacterium]
MRLFDRISPAPPRLGERSMDDKKTLDEVHAALRDGRVDAPLLADVEDLIHRWLAEQHLGIVEEWPKGLIQFEVDAHCINELHGSLMHFVRGNWSHPQAGLAIWAIGKLVRAEDETLFAEALEHGLHGDDNLLYQAVIALDNLELLPGEIMSFSGHDVETNRQTARIYLATRSPG